MPMRWNDAEVMRIVREAGMQALHDMAEHILTEAIDEAPIDTGTLRRSGTVTDAPAEDAVYISFNTPYAAAVHEGYDPFEITVDQAKVLAVPVSKWKGGPVNSYNSKQLPKYSKDGQFVILGRRVQHPGYGGKKYLENPFNRNKPLVDPFVNKRVKEALRNGGM
jgi:hypothetical protein